ncbi:probable protein S-acyltransferase 15 isoform X2 [Arabidopsis lyrata subsp. lyrata]|uniref:probable protein S-acyltransferase 15 isoform X2 n=1 Tax=Arabidopsis lyrata subsp. lyrata TaxID=81972 RepID=UPI000A29B355|nr:probable protein S-acyltransferase 15 isoform X2 [Arabidopsis lyrata subsp. lyrata]|eukprot:XP_020878047.1 probable protein S-acyltransferase 15 isoform X2 [Arabidopsis lyrata subsp. lyrata]
MSCRRFFSIPVLSVILVMGFVYYVTLFIFIDDWVGLRSSAGKLNALLFSFLASLCLFSLSICVLVDPGRVPASYVPDVEDSGWSNGNATETRKCDKCFAYKPLRTHHCRVCRRCVLKMVLLVCCAFKNGDSYAGNVPLKTFIVCCGIFMIGLSITLGTLLCWHIYLIAHNITTIEHYDSKRASWLARKSGQSFRHQFDIGVYKNITSVLGPNMIKWLCPTFTRNSEDGISFSASRDS